ncbi:MAG: ABC transporter family substrate-binding protein [Acidimicrobiales bacterium]
MIRGRHARVGMILTLLLIFAACSGAAEETERGTGTTEQKPGTEDVDEGGTLAYAAEQEPTGFNMLTSKDGLLELRHIMRHIWPYSYSAQPDFSLKPTPVLDGAVPVVSEDPFVLEWKIAERAIWSDGVPVSADDFEWVYLNCNGRIDVGEPTAKDEETGEDITGVDCANTAGYDQISSFDKIDAKTFRATFDGSYVEYESLFGDPLPPAHLGKLQPGGWNTGFDADPLVSAGPYRLKEYVKGDHFTLERNEKYWGPKPHLDTLVFREIPDSANHPDALRNDEVQLINPQPQVDLLDQVTSIPDVRSEVNFGPAWEHLDFNFKNDLLAVKEVRQAIAWGIDRDRYVRTLMKPFSAKAERLDNRVFMANQPDYEAHGKQYAARSPAKATAALEKAGFAKGSDGIYAKDGKRLSFRIRVNSPNALREQLEQLMKADLKGVGIELKIENFGDPETIGSVGSSGDFDLFIFEWVGTPFEVSDTQQTFASDSGANFGGYESPEFDAAIKKAAGTLDEGERVKELNAIDEMLWEDLPNIPLFQKPAGLLAYSTAYANIKDNTTSEGLFWNSEQWGTKSVTAR